MLAISAFTAPPLRRATRQPTTAPAATQRTHIPLAQTNNRMQSQNHAGDRRQEQKDKPRPSGYAGADGRAQERQKCTKQGQGGDRGCASATPPRAARAFTPQPKLTCTVVMGSMSKVFMLLSSKYTSHTTFPLIIFNDPPPDMLHTNTPTITLTL
jgi:hypothetical protein